MRFSTRIKVGVSLLVLAAIVGAFMISGLVSRGYATHAASASQPGATTGTLTPFAVVDPTKLTMTNDSTTPGFTYPKGTRHLHQTGSGHGPHPGHRDLGPSRLVDVRRSPPGGGGARQTLPALGAAGGRRAGAGGERRGGVALC